MKIGILFPGYGGQFVGMAKEVYDEHRSVQEYFEEASNCLNVNFVKLCFASSDQELAAIANAYPSIFLVSVALYDLVRELGLKPHLIAGFGVGTYAALFAAGSINLPDGLYILRKYAEFYSEYAQSLDISLLRVAGILTSYVKKLCAETPGAHISAYISSKDSLVYVPVTSFTTFKKELIEKGERGVASVREVDRSYGLYSPLMEPVVSKLKMYLEKVDFNDCVIPVINTATGAHLKASGRSIKTYVLSRLEKPIHWDKTIKHFDECDIILSIGPGTILADIARMYYPDKDIIVLNNQADLAQVKERLSSLASTQELVEQESVEQSITGVHDNNDHTSQ
jgi:[acyl-carrier-protein] S-malonyltransferase